MTSFESGTLVDSRYEIIEQLGEGGIGTVLKARELGTERIVALKMLHLTLVGDKESLERFKREGAVLSLLEHPNILRCYRFGVWSDRLPYISMEFIDGLPLNKIGPVTHTRALSIAKQICIAMAHAHEHGVVHRDLKPANIIVVRQAESDIIKVVDFGLAKVLPSAARVSQHLTQTGALLGSIYYMSPEQCLGKKADARSDIYSLGCMLYELLNGAPPLVAETPVGMMHMHANIDPKPLHDRETGINATVMRAMAKNPDRRFQSMHEFHSALQLITDGRGAEITELPEKPPLKINGSAPIAVITLLFAVAAATLVLWAYSLAHQDNANGSITLETSKTVEARMVPRTLINKGFNYGESGPDEEMINAWLLKYGSSDKYGTSLANYLLFRKHRFDNEAMAAKYADLAEPALVGLIKSPERSGINKIRLFSCLEDLQLRHPDRPRGWTYLQFHQYLSILDERYTARSAAVYLDSIGAYKEEERIWRTLRQPGYVEKILLARCLHRQGRHKSKTAESKDGISSDTYFEATKALIEMNEVADAESLLSHERPSYSMFSDDIILGYCLTAQKRFTACREYLLSRWDAKIHYREDMIQRASIFAALVHNAAVESSTLSQKEELIEELKQDPVPLALSSYLTSTDNPSLSERLARLAVCSLQHPQKNAPPRAPVRRILVHMLGSAMNDINKPLVVIPLLKEEVLKSPHLVEFSSIGNYLELVRGLRLTGELQEAANVAKEALGVIEAVATTSARPTIVGSHRQVTTFVNSDGSYDRRYASYQWARSARFNLLCEVTQICVEQGNPPPNDETFLTELPNCTIPAVDKVQILERFAKIYRQLGKASEGKHLLAEAEKILPIDCRKPWKNWTMLDDASDLYLELIR